LESEKSLGMEDSDFNKVAEKPGHPCFRETTTGKEDMKLKLRNKKKRISHNIC